MHRVLVVDDEPGIRHIVKLALERIDVVVSEAESGHHALEQLNATSIDVVIVDLTLPDINGINLMGRIRRIAPALPIVLISASTQLQSEANPARPTAVLEKPFKLEQLQNVILRALALRWHDVP